MVAAIPWQEKPSHGTPLDGPEVGRKLSYEVTVSEAPSPRQICEKEAALLRSQSGALERFLEKTDRRGSAVSTHYESELRKIQAQLRELEHKLSTNDDLSPSGQSTEVKSHNSGDTSQKRSNTDLVLTPKTPLATSPDPVDLKQAAKMLVDGGIEIDDAVRTRACTSDGMQEDSLRTTEGTTSAASDGTDLDDNRINDAIASSVRCPVRQACDLLADLEARREPNSPQAATSRTAPCCDAFHGIFQFLRRP
jgi:hypothetical protein